ncbi:pyridoxamine 5'-phosphate oxidase family protein [Streptomyces sp. TRM66268-LWL]|uniref:Pyridoxamine 5'-phosphate oxidase family protein n=1 Tax=Streptomyces polyasparticus TaxID=2767826 RepID=A0ABR7SP62_9ACTN|nr:pyridoxamine 5'-phosphate oxidase family protein [Streptomyces polyasparticus]MBC9717275.1 pyridoxamine 5'-phosphate oxidase family protein [Streptomyces polyasparticus]
MTENWASFSAAEPELAKWIEDRFGAFTHHVLGTLRKDGSVRLTGLEVRFLHGEFWLGMMPGSLKARDLQRDPRFSIMANPGASAEMEDGDARISGRAIEVTDPAERALYVGEVQPPDPDAFHLFRVELTEVVRTFIENDAIVMETWKPGVGVRRTSRR